ncbi:hypothetical protein KIK84_10805 [Curvibacter sp. CHRR-16]|uniref:BPSS1780 family membrane protein n=1 Tax=Curvibacter sp. CHRR-16 TaxID=2835872 RepID=UPI001BDB2600|nr:BPSS1780 family membrane protein [Curvibacter sp. CHRR-16]MBT0570820.1 hypothetical protein [Curvibacter sp. CHRR-16]
MKLHTLPASTGWQWVRAGLRTFWRQPLAMSGLFFLMMLLLSFIGAIPYVGTLLALTLFPAATLGFMVASEQAQHSKFPLPTVLISAFRAGPERMRNMAKLGFLYAGCLLVAMLLSSIIDGGTFAKLYLHGGDISPEAVARPEFMWAGLVALGLYFVLSAVFWHAPALVYWHNLSPIKSLVFSFMGCWHNWRAYLVYALCWAGLSMGVTLTVATLTSLTGNDQIVITALVPTTLLLASMYFCSFYTTFVETFDPS